jgi:hypothetical protein
MSNENMIIGSAALRRPQTTGRSWLEFRPFSIAAQESDILRSLSLYNGLNE